MNQLLSQSLAGLARLVLISMPAQAIERQTLQGHVPRAISVLDLTPTGQFPGSLYS